MKVSVVIAVLESYEVVKREMAYYNRFLPKYPDVEFILVDDGSDPEIPIPENIDFPLMIVRTKDKRPWTQPCARNRGALMAKGEFLLMTDIDHFFSEEAINAVRKFDGDKMMFPRRLGVLDERGGLVLDEKVLDEYGKKKNAADWNIHYNTFAIRASVFHELKGYDPKFCGKYGGDDTDFSRRYGELHKQGKAKRHVMGPGIYVYPDPKADRKRIFHHWRWPNEKRD